eukprot:symbB.v1.2.039081.t1/scaffold6338.1/size21769/1
MKTRVMKKKAVSKIARGKLAKVVVFKGNKEKTASGKTRYPKEKTASGKTRSDLMKNKRNKVVSKKQNAAGKKAYANISTWTSSVIKARKELGIKGFCAINGTRRSTSSWCVRASTADVVEVQTDKHSAAGGASAGAAFGGACSMTSMGGACRISSCDCGRCSMTTCGEAFDYEDVKAADGKDAKEENKESKFAEFLERGAEATWTSVQNFHVTQLFGDRWKQYITKQLFVLDFIWQCMLVGEDAGQADFHHECKQRREHVFEIIVDSISEQVQMRFFLDHIGMKERALDDDDEHHGEDQEVQQAPCDALGSTEDVLQDVKMKPTADKKKGKSFYDDFMKKKQQTKEAGLLAKAAGMASSFRGGMMQAEDSDDDQAAAHEDYLRVNESSTLGSEQGPIEDPLHAFKSMWNGEEDWVVCKRFKRVSRDQAEQDEELIKRPWDLQIQSRHEEGSRKRHGTPGSTEDVSWDATMPEDEDGNKKVEKLAKHASNANGLLRGGMANSFQVLEEQDEDEDIASIEHQSEHGTAETGSQAMYDEEQHEQDDSMTSGKSYYAAFYQRKAEMRGGAGGSNTTQNKKLTNALDALTNVMKALEPTQETEAATPDEVIKQINELVTQWQAKTPTRGEMRTELQKLHVKLERDVRRQAEPEASREAAGHSLQQSFYGDFVRKLKGEDMTEDENWTTKGKGKKGNKGAKDKSGKGGKGKNSGNHTQRFDLQKIWPMKDISTSQILAKELENGKEPTGTVVAVENCEKIAEFQSLSKAHTLKKTVILVAKAGDETPTNIANPEMVWLPYLSNLALVKAIVATTTGEKAEVQGMQPIQNNKSAAIEEKLVTLRIIVDLWLIPEKRAQEYLKAHPHAALHHAMKKTKCQEIKTHGWVVGENLMSGYCSVTESDAKIVLAQSGISGVFVTRLRQDVITQPPVTWVRVEENEGVQQYYQRVMQLAAEAGVALARRAGGGAFLGYLKEDESDRNRAWQICGVPMHWGPQTVRSWLQDLGWKVEQNPKPPNGKYKTWAFQGRMEGQGKQTNFAYALDNGGKASHITIQHWNKKRTPTEEERSKETRVKGSRWWSADDTDPIEAVSPTKTFEAEIAPTVMETDEQDGQGGKRSQESQPGAVKEGNSPEKKKSKRAPALLSPVLKGGCSGPDGSVLIDLGGGGDCGWRALAYMVATQHSPQNGDKAADRIEILARTMRAKVVSYLIQHQDQWKSSWTPDDKANTTTEAGAPATNFQEFVGDVLQREKRWMCGLCLAGAALSLHCTIVVWQYKGRIDQVHLKEHWSRAAIIRGKDTQKPVVVPVVLHHGHYFALRLPSLRKAWPKEWCNTKEDEKVALTQDIDNTQELSTICRGGKEEEEMEEICLADWSADASGSTEDVPRDIGLTNRLRGGAKEADEDAEEVEELLRPFDEKAFCTPKKENKSNGNHDEEMLKSFSTRRTASTKRSVDSLLKSFRMDSTSKKPRPGRIGVNLHKKKHNTWTCPVCSEVVEITDRKKGLSYIGSHLKKFPYATFQSAVTENSKRHRWGAGLGLRGLVKAIPFQAMEKSRWKEEAEYVCPYCEEALPKLAGKKTNLNDTRTWRMVNLIGDLSEDERPDILCIQETSCTDHQWIGLQRVMTQHGFRGFHTAGRQLGESQQGYQWHRGIATFVNDRLGANWLGGHSSSVGQFHAVAVDNLLVVNYYVIPRDEAITQQACNLQDFIEELRWRGRWVFMGDYNEVYPGSWIATLATIYGGWQPGHTFDSTRWSGRRVIDYMVANFDLPDMQAREEKLSDHKIITCEFEHHHRFDAEQWRFQPGVVFAKPEWVSKARWQQIFNESFIQGQQEEWSESCKLVEQWQDWDDIDCNDGQSAIDLEWCLCCAQLSWAFTRSMKLAICEIPSTYDNVAEMRRVLHLVNHLHIKGFKCDIQQRKFSKQPRRVNMNQRKAQVRNGRLHELCRRLNKNNIDCETKNLVKKLYGDIDAEEIEIQDVVHDLRRREARQFQEEKDGSSQAISAWKHNMRHNMKAKTSWINKKGSKLSPSVETENGITSTKVEAAKALHDYWQSLWQQQQWCEEEKPSKIKRIVELLKNDIKQVKIAEGRPSFKHFRECMGRISGCAGADGWTAEELSMVAASRAASRSVWEVMMRKWKEVADSYHLIENQSKAQFVNMDQKGSAFEVLGTVIGNFDEESQQGSRLIRRVQDIGLLYKKIGIMPTRVHEKINDVGTFGRAKLAYGWVSLKPLKDWIHQQEQALWKGIGKLTYANPHMRRTIGGANTSLRMVAFLRQLRLLSQRNAKLQDYGVEVTQCQLDQLVNSTLAELGWRQQDGKFVHDLYMDGFRLEDLIFEATWKKVGHHVRESFRKAHYDLYGRSGRHELSGHDFPPYDGKRRALACKWAKSDGLAWLLIQGCLQFSADEPL